MPPESPQFRIPLLDLDGKEIMTREKLENSRDSQISWQLEDGLISERKASELRKMHPQKAYDWLRANSGRKDKISWQFREGLISDKRVLELEEMDAIEADEWLSANSNRRSMILSQLARGLISKDRARELEEMDAIKARDWLKFNSLFYFKVSQQLKDNLITQKKAQELREMDRQKANKWLSANRERDGLVNFRLEKGRISKKKAEELKNIDPLEALELIDIQDFLQLKLNSGIIIDSKILEKLEKFTSLEEVQHWVESYEYVLFMSVLQFEEGLITEEELRGMQKRDPREAAEWLRMNLELEEDRKRKQIADNFLENEMRKI